MAPVATLSKRKESGLGREYRLLDWFLGGCASVGLEAEVALGENGCDFG